MAGEDKEILISIKVDNEQAQKSITDQTLKITKLQDANTKLKDKNKELAKSEGDTTAQRAKNSEEIAKNTLKISQANAVRKRAITSQKAEAGSLNNLRNTLATLTAKRNQDLVVGSKAFNQANKDIDGLNASIKKAEQGGGDFRRSVGNYSTALDGVGESVSKVSPALGGMVTGFVSATKAALAFIATPIGAVLAAVGAAVAAVIQYFKRTEGGGDKLAVVMATLSGSFEAVMDVVAGLGKLLFDVFVGGFNLIANQFKLSGLAMQEVILALDVAWQKVFGSTEDYEKAQEDLKKNTEEIIKVGKEQVQIVKDTTKGVIANTGALVDNIAKTGEKIEKTIAQARAERDLQKATITATTANAERNRQIFEGLKLSKDETKSFEERKKGLELASKAEQEMADSKVYLAQKAADIARAQFKINDSDLDARQALAEADAKVTEAQTASLRVQTKIQASKITLLKQEEAEINALQAKKKKAAEDDQKLQEEILVKTIESEQKLKEVKAISAAEDIEDAQERLIAFTAIEKERLRIQLEDETLLKADIELLEFESGQRIAVLRENAAAQQDDIRKRNLEKDKAAAETKKKLNKDVLNNSTNALNDALTFAQIIAGKDEKLQRRLATIKTVINTAVGIGRAFADLPIYAAIPAAAVVAATGVTQIAAINNSESGNVSSTSATVPTTNTPTADTSQADTSANQQAALSDAISNLGLTVAVSEINDAQSNVKVAEDNSTI